MRGEYDLVIIGGSYTARYAAGMAAQRKIRVALVEPNNVKIQPFSLGEIYQAYQNLPSLAGRPSVAEQYRGDTITLDQSKRLRQPQRKRSPKESEFLHYYQRVNNFLESEFDLPELSQLGVDVIIGRGSFQKLPQLAFVIDKRILRSQRYLLAPELISVLPEIPGLEESSYTIPADLVSDLKNNLEINLENSQESLAQSWIVMGNPYVGVEMSQLLRNLGKTVTLVSPKPRLLPQEEPEANALIQGAIEAAGIRLLTHSPVTLIRYLEGKSWIQAGDQAIEAEKLLLCPRQIPQTTGLNLAAAGVEVNRHSVVVNQYLQTTNSHIYACSDQNGLGAYQGAIALKNALILPIFPVNYQHQPRIISTQPPLAQIGSTEQEARQRYGKQVITLREYVKNQPLAQMRGDTTGFCQLIIHSDGRILGGTIVGTHAREIISLIAFAMRAGLKVDHLAKLPETNGSLLQRTAAQGLTNKSKFYEIWQELKQRFRG